LASCARFWYLRNRNGSRDGPRSGVAYVATGAQERGKSMSSVNRNPVEIGASPRLAVVTKPGSGKPNGSKSGKGNTDGSEEKGRSRSLATAVSLHLEGKAEEALKELRRA